MPPKESARNFEDRVVKRRRTNAGATPRPSVVQSTEQWKSSYYRRSGPADPWADLRYHHRSDASPTNSSFNSVGCVHIIYCPQVQFVPDPVEPWTSVENLLEILEISTVQQTVDRVIESVICPPDTTGYQSENTFMSVVIPLSNQMPEKVKKADLGKWICWLCIATAQQS